MHRELLLHPPRVMPDIEHRPVYRHVVIGPPGLQDRLAAGDVGVQAGRVAPDRIAGIVLQRSIEQPTGPGRVLGAVAGPVEENVVDSVQEELIDLGLDLRQCGPEMVAHPRAGFRSHQRFAHYMRRRRGHTVNHRLGMIFANVVRLAPYARDFERAGAEGFGLGYPGCGVQVKQIRRRPVRLVARGAPLSLGPPGEGLDILQVQIGEGLAIVALDPGDYFAISLSEKFGQMSGQTISAAFLEFFGQFLAPVAPELEGVMVHRARKDNTAAGERFVEMLEVRRHCPWRVGINRLSRPAGRGAFNRSPGELPAQFTLIVGDHRVAIVIGDHRTAERPARARGHVHPHAQAPGFFGRVTHHLDELRR